MKRLFFLSVVAIALGLAMPQFAQAKSSFNGTIVMDEVTYQEITVEELPEAVTGALAADYAGYKVDKAYKGDDGSYKLKVTNETDISYVLFYSSTGELTKVEQKK